MTVTLVWPRSDIPPPRGHVYSSMTVTLEWPWSDIPPSRDHVYSFMTLTLSDLDKTLILLQTVFLLLIGPGPWCHLLHWLFFVSWVHAVSIHLVCIYLWRWCKTLRVLFMKSLMPLYIPEAGDPEGMSFPDSDGIQFAIAAFPACVLPVRGLVSYRRILNVCSFSCMLLSSTICLVNCIIWKNDVLLIIAVMSVPWSSSISGADVLICSSSDILLSSSLMSFVDGITGFFLQS